MIENSVYGPCPDEIAEEETEPRKTWSDGGPAINSVLRDIATTSLADLWNAETEKQHWWQQQDQDEQFIEEQSNGYD